jgi:hypothetical protein
MRFTDLIEDKRGGQRGGHASLLRRHAEAGELMQRGNRPHARDGGLQELPAAQRLWGAGFEQRSIHGINSRQDKARAETWQEGFIVA